MKNYSSIRYNDATLNEEEFNRFRDLVTARTGLYFHSKRRDTFAASILSAASGAGCTCLDDYYQRLRSTPTHGDLWIDLIPRLTVCETYFFRDAGLISALRDHILPDLISRHSVNRSLRLWSAGCATGEEAYTLAILLRQLLSDIEVWDIKLLATDINHQALAQAITGHYRPWSFRQTNPAIREQYFTPLDSSFVINLPLRKMVTFGYLNLAEAGYPSAASQTNGQDLIVWRNVSLYLPEDVTREVVDRLYDCLSPGGWLIVGPSETNADIYHRFELVRFEEAFVYRKSQLQTAILPASVRGISDRIDPRELPPFDINPENTTGFLPPNLAAQKTLQAKGESPVTHEEKSAHHLYQEGLIRLESRQPQEALQCFLAFLEQNPADAAAYHQIACLHANGGRLADARQWAERALEQNPLLEEAHYTLALIHREQSDLEAAIACLKRVLYLKPGFILAHLGLAECYKQLSRGADSARHQAQAIRLASQLTPDAILLGSDHLTAGQLLAHF